MASPRSIPVPDSPLHSAQTPAEPALGDAGKTSAFFGRNCILSQSTVRGNANYDQLSYGQLHELCKQRGYHKKDDKAVRRTRLEAMAAAANKAKGGSSNDMDTSTSVLDKRARNLGDPTDIGTSVDGDTEKRARGGVRERA